MYNLINVVNLDENTKRKLPILNVDETWLEIFGEVDDEEIIKKRQELEKLQNGKEEARKQLSILNSQKKQSMQHIIRLSDELNNKKGISDVSLLDAEKKNLESINFDLDNVRFEYEVYPQKIVKANVELLEATLKYSSIELNRRDEENHEINQEMIEIRDRLKDLFTQRTINDQWNEKTYVFLHSALGAKLIEKIDNFDSEQYNEDRN